MGLKLSMDDDKSSQVAPTANKGNQSAMLVLLLLIVGGFSYVYFFTGLIKPQEAAKPAEAPPKAQMVKMPLPPLPGNGDSDKTVAKPAEVKKAAVQAPTAPVAAVAPTAMVTAQTPAKPKEEPKKFAADKKPVAAEKKTEPAKPDKKASADGTQKSKKAAKYVKTVKMDSSSAGSGTWSILVGTYVLEDALSTDMGRVRKAGLDPVVMPGTPRKSPMNRLFVSEFDNRADAMATLDKLKRHTSDAFILDHGEKYSVFAGSYMLDARAVSEVERLNTAGFKVSLKHAEVSIPSQSLTLGPFSDKKAAEAALGKLKAAGVKAAISRQ